MTPEHNPAPKPNQPVRYAFDFLTETGKHFRIVTDKPLFDGTLPLVRFLDAAEMPKVWTDAF